MPAPAAPSCARWNVSNSQLPTPNLQERGWELEIGGWKLSRGIDMSGESFEWAIKKDIRNNPIVREVDQERYRDMWRSVGFGVFLVVVLVFAAFQQCQLNQY